VTWRALLAPSVALIAGCGGAAPLLHPAQVLPTGEIRAMAGIAARTVVGNLGDALRGATNEAAAQQAQNPNSVPVIDTTYAQGALVAAAMAPDLSPVAGARVGVGGGFEGGIMYTGRGARIDLRREFKVGRPAAWSLSVGLGLDTAFEGRQTDAGLYGVDNANLFGFGADVPVLIGWHSTAGLYYFWAGARIGYEYDTIQPHAEQVGTQQGTGPQLIGNRVAVGGLLGFAIGFKHVHVALELEADYAYITGTFGGGGQPVVAGVVDGVSLTPATALWWDF
jgi:hypothetical protein